VVTHWVTIASSVIARYKYEASTSRLYVEFHSGAMGYYSRIEAELFGEFTRAESRGSFLVWRIQSQPDEYPYTSTRQGT
jgi:hypothetical protein